MKKHLVLSTILAAALAAGSAHAAGEAGQSAGATGGVGQAQTQQTAQMGSPDSQSVRMMQEALRNEGYDLQVDGVWGPNTQQALQDFTQRHGDTMGGAGAGMGGQQALTPDRPAGTGAGAGTAPGTTGSVGATGTTGTTGTMGTTDRDAGTIGGAAQEQQGQLGSVGRDRPGTVPVPGQQAPAGLEDSPAVSRGAADDAGGMTGGTGTGTAGGTSGTSGGGTGGGAGGGGSD